MQKKNKKIFIDKSKAVTFRLLYRDGGDPNRTEENKDQRIFQIVENESNNQNPEYQKNKQRYLQEFSDKDQGKFDQKKAIKHKYKDEDMIDNLKERDDLWISHIMKRRAEEEQDIEEEIVDIEEQECSEDSFEALEYQIQDIQDDITKQAAQLAVHDIQQFQVTFQNVQMKKLNEYGLPDTGYDYSQHFAKGNVGELVADIRANYDVAPVIKMDLDYEEKEMTKEQKEVFQALQNENQDVVYEDLEDDFVMLARGDEEIVMKKEKEDKKQDKITNQTNKTKQVYRKTEENGVFKEEEGEYQTVEQMQDIYQELDDLSYEEEELEEFEDIKEKGGKQKKLTNQQFDSIIDQHLRQIDNRKTSKQPPHKPHKQIKFAEDYEEEQEQEQEKEQEKEQEQEKEKEEKEEEEETIEERKHIRNEKKYLAKLEKVRQHQEMFGIDQVHTKKHVEQLAYEEDQALQNYQQHSFTEEESQQEEEEEEYQPPDNIISHTLQNTFISTHINIIREAKNNRDYQKKQQKLLQQQQQQQEEEDQENTNELKEKVKEVFKKRDRKETKEEKAKRKQVVKEFKEQRKNKKKQFKEELNTQQKHCLKVSGQNASNNLNGLHVHKL